MSALTDQLNDELLRLIRIMKSAAGRGPTDAAAMWLLWPLRHAGPMRLGELAEAKGVDASTVSRQVAELTKAGLVRRDPDPADRRAALVALTDAGRDACTQLIEARRRAIAAALTDWSDEQLAAFTDLFRQFNTTVEAHLAATGTTRTSP